MKTIAGMTAGLAGLLGLVLTESAIAQDVDLTVALAGGTPVQGVQGRPGGVARAQPEAHRPNSPRYDRERRLTCRSNGRFNRCSTGGRISSLRYLASQSSRRCEIGRDWGVERNAVWVDNGCTASFEVATQDGRYDDDWRDDRRRDDDYGYGRSPQGYGELEYIKCESEDRRYRLCRIHGNFSDVRLYDRRSDAGCRHGTDWGVTREGVWVKNGCRAVFSYVERGDYRRY